LSALVATIARTPRPPFAARARDGAFVRGLLPLALVSKGTDSGHALDRMQERGVPPSVVEDTIARGSHTPSENGTIVHETEQARVVTDAQTGRVVTVIPR
jgi:hypothetical protein